MATKSEIESFLNDSKIPRNLKNRLGSAITRDYGTEGFDSFSPEAEMSPRVNGAYLAVKDQYAKGSKN